MKIPKKIKQELNHFYKTRIPRCPKCKVNYINDIDAITKKISPYTWKPQCEHLKDLRLSIG